MQKQRVGILIFEDVEVLDFAGPFEIFSRTRLEPGTQSRRSEESAPFEVVTVGCHPGLLRATGGLVIQPTFPLASAPPLDVLVVPGGFGTRRLLEDSAVLAFVRARAAAAAQVASVCTGALVLARAGLLENRRATTHWAAYDLLAELDPTIDVRRGERVVEDDLLTSAGVAAGIDMALHYVEHHCGKSVADETAHYVEYPRDRTGTGAR